MKEGWTYKRLGEVATIVGGSTPKTSVEKYWGGTHYWVTPANLDGNKYQGATPRTITDSAVKETNLQLLPIGTVLLSSRAPIGKIAITTVPMYCNQGFKNIVCSDLLLNEFVYWYLFGKVDYLNSLGKGATFKEISKKATEQIPIPVPSIAEQQHIVDYLNAAFAQIDELKSNAERQLAEARALFQSALTQAMQPKPGWQVFSFSQLIKLKSGDNLPAKSFVEGEYPVYGGNGIAGYHNQYNKEGGQIVIGRVGALCGNVRFLESPFWLTDNGFEVILDKEHKMDLPFLTYLLNFCNLRQYARQAAQPVISNVSLKDIQLNIPPLSEQHVIVEHLDAFSNRIRELEEISRKTAAECDALKQALLRQIFE